MYWWEWVHWSITAVALAGWVIVAIVVVGATLLKRKQRQTADQLLEAENRALRERVVIWKDKAERSIAELTALHKAISEKPSPKLGKLSP